MGRRYITENVLLRERGRHKEKEERKENDCSSYHLESFRRSTLKNEEEESFLEPSPRIYLYLSFRRFDHPISL